MDAFDRHGGAGHGVYRIHVKASRPEFRGLMAAQTKPDDKGATYEVELQRRYSDVQAFWKAMSLRHPGVRLPPIPSKKLRHDAQVYEERRQAFDALFKFIAQHEQLCVSPVLLSFVGLKPHTAATDEPAGAGSPEQEPEPESSLASGSETADPAASKSSGRVVGASAWARFYTEREIEDMRQQEAKRASTAPTKAAVSPGQPQKLLADDDSEAEEEASALKIQPRSASGSVSEGGKAPKKFTTVNFTEEDIAGDRKPDAPDRPAVPASVPVAIETIMRESAVPDSILKADDTDTLDALLQRTELSRRNSSITEASAKTSTGQKPQPPPKPTRPTSSTAAAAGAHNDDDDDLLALAARSHSSARPAAAPLAPSAGLDVAGIQAYIARNEQEQREKQRQNASLF